MEWPQVVVASLLGLQVLAGFLRDGSPRGNVSFVMLGMEAALWALLLNAGGFWD